MLEIGYHFVIFEDGEMIACRPLDQQGTHTRGFNERSIGVCLMGGLRIVDGPDGEPIERHCDTFTEAQKDKVMGLMVWLEAQYPGIKLRAHTEMGKHGRTHGFPCPALNMDALRSGRYV